MNFFIAFLLLVGIGGSRAAITMIDVYEEDFSMVSLPVATQATLGGFGPFASFGEIAVADLNAGGSVQNGVLEVVSNTSEFQEPPGDFRGIGIVLEASAFVGIGSYELQYDIPSFELNSEFGSHFNDTAEVSIWAGSEFENSTANGLLVNAQTGVLEVLSGGNAVSENLALQSISFSDPMTTGTFNLNFEYDGSSAIVLYFGARSDGFPFPVVQFDNIRLSPVAVPEPSVMFYLPLLVVVSLWRRRAKR